MVERSQRDRKRRCLKMFYLPLVGVLLETRGHMAQYFQLKKIERQIKHKERKVPMEI